MFYITRIFLIIGSYVAAYLLSTYFFSFYRLFSSATPGGTYITAGAAAQIIGTPIAAVFFLFFVLSLVRGSNSWWWIGAASAPALLFFALLDVYHIYVPIAVGFVAWGFGLTANKLLRKLAPSLISRIGAA